MVDQFNPNDSKLIIILREQTDNKQSLKFGSNLNIYIYDKSKSDGECIIAILQLVDVIYSRYLIDYDNKCIYIMEQSGIVF